MERRHRPGRRLLRLLACNAAIGLAFGLAFATALVAADVHGLGTLMGQTIGRAAGWGILALVFGTAFAGIAAATGVMLLGREDESGPAFPSRIPVPAPSQRHRV